MKSLTFLLAAGALLLGVACTRDRISSVQLTSTNLPVVTGSGYTWVESKRGSRVKRGIVISNALPVYTTDELKGITPCLVFTGDDPTVNNLLFHRAVEVNRSPTLPNIPIFFMSREKIHVQSLSSNLVLKSEGAVRVQNVKLIRE